MQTRRGFINPLKASISRMHSESKILMNKCISVTELVSICENSIPNKYVTFKFFNVIFFGPHPSHFENLRKKLYHPLPTPPPPPQYHNIPSPPLQLSTVEYHSSCYVNKECETRSFNIYEMVDVLPVHN